MYCLTQGLAIKFTAVLVVTAAMLKPALFEATATPASTGACPPTHPNHGLPECGSVQDSCVPKKVQPLTNTHPTLQSCRQHILHPD